MKHVAGSWFPENTECYFPGGRIVETVALFVLSSKSSGPRTGYSNTHCPYLARTQENKHLVVGDI
jgi:hypothetical protein